MFLLNVRICPRHGQCKYTTNILIYQIILHFLSLTSHRAYRHISGFYAPFYKKNTNNKNSKL